MSQSITQSSTLEEFSARFYIMPTTGLTPDAKTAHQDDFLTPSKTKNAKLVELVKGNHVSTPWCDEFEKMISGMPFSSAKADSMTHHKVQVRRLLSHFNNPAIPTDATFLTLQTQRMADGAKILGRMGANCTIDAPLFCVWGCNTLIGDNIYINRNVSIFDSAPVRIGSNTFIGPNVILTTDSHGTDISLRRRGLGFAHPITIGEDCWIGAGVTILPGVTIGNGCTIGAGAVVTRSIPECSVAAGVPARVMRQVEHPA